MGIKIYEGRDGKYVTFERADGWWHVRLCDATRLIDKVRCDDYREALSYRKSFIKIARARFL